MRMPRVSRARFARNRSATTSLNIPLLPKRVSSLKYTASYWITLAALATALVGLAVLPASRRLAAAPVQDLSSLLPGQDRLVNGKIITQPPLGTVSKVGSFP